MSNSASRLTLSFNFRFAGWPFVVLLFAFVACGGGGGGIDVVAGDGVVARDVLDATDDEVSDDGQDDARDGVMIDVDMPDDADTPDGGDAPDDAEVPDDADSLDTGDVIDDADADADADVIDVTLPDVVFDVSFDINVPDSGADTYADVEQPDIVDDGVVDLDVYDDVSTDSGTDSGQGYFCMRHEDCDDWNICTDNYCDYDLYECVNQPVMCIDGNPCTWDECVPDTGCVFTALNFSDLDPCTDDSCDLATGAFLHVPKICPADDACHEGFCEPSTGLCQQVEIGCNDDNVCTTDTCDPVTGCRHTPVDCNDNNACTADTCDSLTGCWHALADCNDNNACTADTCDPVAGCRHSPVVCDDEDLCTLDACDALSGCVQSPVVCDDGDPMTLDGCDPASGCTHVPYSCDDGDACTLEHWDPTLDCVYVPRDCDDDDACTVDGCDVFAGCTHVMVDCNDNNACTADTCDAVTGCRHTPVDCNDNNACTADTCDPVMGCRHAAVVCNDNNVCTTDTCDAATGCRHTPVTCNDNNPCTADYCDPAAGCRHTPIICDDNNACTWDWCNADSICVYTPINCDDQNICTTDSCDTRTGCNFDQVLCDDGNACTTDSCDQSVGCTNIPIVCNDYNACTADTCDPLTGCKYTTISCKDYNACTADTCDPLTGCKYTTISCNDYNACTADTCDPLTGCKYTTISCNDNNACTADSCHPSTGCYNILIPCDDGDVCTSDSCDLLTGCTHTWICAAEVCNNGYDDNDDGLRDCADPACFADDACHGDSCDDAWLLPGTAVVNVDTVPLTPGFPAGCEQTPGTDIVFRLDVPVTSDVHLSTMGSDYDTALSIRAAPCDRTEYLACSDDVSPQIQGSRVEVRSLGAGTWFVRVSDASGGDGGRLRLNVVVTPAVVADWPATTQDPLVRMPGTQPTDGLTMESPSNCSSCHAGFDAPVEPGRNWRGSMMAQASRDFLFWTTMVVAIQDSLWALGTPNAADLCERCHFPQGWVEGRSDPPNASAMIGTDYDGVHCDVCHSKIDPHFEDTFAGTREGSNWLNYWDETNLSGTRSSTAAATTRAADRTALSPATFFNGQPFLDPVTFRPVAENWNESASGQFFLAGGRDKRASFADAGAKHPILYSRHHKSRYFCATCHDVTNPALANLDFAGIPPGAGGPALPSETRPAWDMTHVERTFSEFMLSAFGVQGGAPGSGAFDPATFTTSFPSNTIATCQDCHMADMRGRAANKASAVLRPDDSVEHPNSGLPDHSMAGGNPFVLTVLASTVVGSTNYDPVNAALLAGQSAALTLDLAQGMQVDSAIALEGADKAIAMLEAAASIQGLSYDPVSGDATFRIVNHTGHKLLTGFPEGRRLFVNIRAWQATTLMAEINPYDVTAGTLRGLDPQESPASPPLAAHEQHADDLVYECRMASSLTGESHSFHFVLSTHRNKDNRVPPKGFRIGEAPLRKAEPVLDGESAPGLYSADEYAGGYDDVALKLPAGATRVEVTLYYQATSREYIEFLRNEIAGLTATLTSPTPAGGALTYVSGDLPFFDRLRAWGTTIWQLWEHNRNVPGAAPIPMAHADWGL